MTARRPYDPDEHGPGPSRPGPADSHPPEQRGYPPRGDVPTAGRRPDPGGPPPRPRPEPEAPRNQPPPSAPSGRDDEPVSASWSDDEKTRMVGKLGFVPPEIRGNEETSNFDPDRVDPGDRTKFRKRKRAKKTPIGTKIGIGAAVVVLVAALGGGVYLLATSGEDDKGAGTAYEALDKPCDALDTEPISKLVGKSKVSQKLNETEKRTHSARQDCSAMYGKPGEGGEVAIHSEVYKDKAGAKNACETARDEAAASETSTQQFKKVSDRDSGFAVQRSTGTNSQTVDYELHYVERNVCMSVRASIYNGGASAKEAAKYAGDLGDAYTQKWAGL